MDQPSPDAVVPLPTDPCGRLLRLHELARHWLTEVSPPSPYKEAPEGATRAYSDLIFAFGLARCGAAEPAASLSRQAREVLAANHEVAACLLDGFAYRIGQALQEHPYWGPLPTPLLNRIEQMESVQRYAVERLRQYSRILEPDQKVDALQRFYVGASALNGELMHLANLTDPKQVAAQVERLFREGPALDRQRPAEEARARVLRAGLSVAPCIGQDFALWLLGRLGPVLDALPLPAPGQYDELRGQADLLATGLSTAARFERLDHVQTLVSRFRQLLESQPRTDGVLRAINLLAGQCFRALRKFDRREEIDQLLTQVASLILESRQVSTFQDVLQEPFKEEMNARGRVPDGWVEARLALLHLAACWYYFGRDDQADAVLDAVRALLFEGSLMSRNRKRDQMLLACEYVHAAAQAPLPGAQQRLEELLSRLEVGDLWSTLTYYSLSRLRVIEAVVLAVAPLDAG